MPEPTVISAGLSYSWSKSLTDYPASTWTLAYSLVNHQHQYDISAAANGDDYAVSITKTESAIFEPGRYHLIGFVDDGTDRVQIYAGEVYVYPDYTEVADLRTWAEKTLDAVEAVIANTATKDQQSVMVDGQTLIRRSMADLIMLRDRMRREVAAEKRAADVAAGLGHSGRVQLRFK